MIEADDLIFDALIDGTSYAFTTLNLEGGYGSKKIDDLSVALRQFPHIRNVNMAKNALWLADEMTYLPFLQDLNVSHNRLRDIRFLKENRESLCYLKVSTHQLLRKISNFL